ncbi:unnamed protein product [Pseudo-nitzschia multistriata]|uniref:RxLR effector protein n=1 Tax=Pseudo-nitzschia multistriata TaxID=183589 RepID=A0A448ZRU9_9STRA|nr:unnamed protein product [Pseudo-nitzschia multistriata]
MAVSMKSSPAVLLASALLLCLLAARGTEGFATGPVAGTRGTASQTRLSAEQPGGNNNNKGNPVFGAISNFFAELDAFVDDATARRLGNGAAYYGKRKSSFYGKDDAMKKQDRDVADSEEDYMVNSGGNYKWITDENGQLRPVSRMKNKSLEKPLEFWGRKDKNEE